MANGLNIPLNQQNKSRTVGARDKKKRKRKVGASNTFSDASDFESGTGEVFEADDELKKIAPGTKYFVPYASGTKMEVFPNKQSASKFAKEVGRS